MKKMMKTAAIMAALMLSMAMFAGCQQNSTKEESKTEAPAETQQTETAKEETPAEAEKAEAIDLTAKAEEIKAANDKVSEIQLGTSDEQSLAQEKQLGTSDHEGHEGEITFTEAEDGITVEVRMVAEAAEEDVSAVNAALVAVLDDEDVVAANLFGNTEEAVNKSYTISYFVGESEEVNYVSTAAYYSLAGRKGMNYIQNDAWAGPSAPEAE